MEFKIEYFRDIKAKRQFEIVQRMIQYEGVNFTHERLLDIMKHYNPQMILHYNTEKFFNGAYTNYLIRELCRLNEVYKDEGEYKQLSIF
jgi:hypothetical protein